VVDSERASLVAMSLRSLVWAGLAFGVYVILGLPTNQWASIIVRSDLSNFFPK
jgi:hypothetical protein